MAGKLKARRYAEASLRNLGKTKKVRMKKETEKILTGKVGNK
jgi:hypothetical protein